MKPPKTLSRLTLDIPTTLHKKLKSSAAERCLSMKALILLILEQKLPELSDYEFNHTQDDPKAKVIQLLHHLRKLKN